MSPVLLGGVLGLVAAIGALIAIAAAPPLRPIRLDDRLYPYLRDAPAPSRLLASDPVAGRGLLGAVRRVVGPLLGDLTTAVDRTLGGRGSVRRRLDSLGRSMSVEEFRIEQVLWGALGLIAGVLLTGAISVSRGRFDLLIAGTLCIGGLLGGVLGRDWWLGNEVAKREQAIRSEFPVIAELLALAVAAGEGPVGAIERVCRLTRGELTRDLADTLARSRAGLPLADALQGFADRIRIDEVSRFIDGLVVAIERGTPLAEVLRAQAADVRAGGKRALLESGGRKEIAMMV